MFWKNRPLVLEYEFAVGRSINMFSIFFLWKYGHLPVHTPWDFDVIQACLVPVPLRRKNGIQFLISQNVQAAVDHHDNTHAYRP